MFHTNVHFLLPINERHVAEKINSLCFWLQTKVLILARSITDILNTLKREKVMK